uniref:Uncharacterized protein n=1 Tax=Zea mays TaxID=4577 RepID=A0A804PRF9_MAIZE
MPTERLHCALHPRSNNAAVDLAPAMASVRRGPPASVGKENQRPKNLGHGKATTATTTAELTKPTEPEPAPVG